MHIKGLLSRVTRANVLVAVGVFVVGSLIGVGLFTFIYAKGISYLFNDPATCANCHVMERHYDAWIAGSHSNVATCNDCHAPHDNIVHKYVVKADNGFWHGLKFTTGQYPENIEIRESNRTVTNEACLYCHADFTSDIRMTAGSDQINCTRCHSDVGHSTR